MTTEHPTNGLIGASPKRVEDPPLITGKGCYIDDIQLPGMLYLAFQRSPYPHAKIISIDTSKAKTMPGVELVDHRQRSQRETESRAVAGAAEHDNSARIRCSRAARCIASACRWPPWSRKTRAQAQDAANAIEVEYDELPGVSNAEEALKPGAPLAHQELDSNICYTMTKNGGDVDKAFAAADHVFTMHIASPRQVALAMEPRGIAVNPDPVRQESNRLAVDSGAPSRPRRDLQHVGLSRASEFI